MTGTGASGVCLLADTDADLRHFMLQRLLRRSGLSNTQLAFALTGEPGLIGALQARNIKAVVPMGERALWQTLGESDIVRWRGRVAQHPLLPGIHVIPTFTPSKLLTRRGDDEDASDAMRHPPRFHGIWMRDVHYAMEVARTGFHRMPVEYLLDPPVDRFAQFVLEYEAALAADAAWLSWDIETVYKSKKSEEELDIEDRQDGAILRISFAFRPGYAVSVPWESAYMPWIRRLLASRGIHVVWNGTTFDIPVVTADGCEVNGVIYEGMDAYHLLQSDLPKGLEWVSAEATDLLPWKHLAQAQPTHYSCVDADAALRNMLWLREQLTATGQWGLFERHVVQLMPILGAAGRRGNLVDLEKRELIRSKLLAMKDELITEAQAYVPRELLPRTVYKGQPDGVEGEWPKSFEPRKLSALAGWDVVYEPSREKVCSACGGFASNKSEHFKGAPGPPHPKSGKPTRLKNPCKLAGGVIERKPAYTPEFHRLELFNPNSSPQMRAYMRHFGHPIGKDKRDASKETCDASHLKFLRKKVGEKFPIYTLALELHKAIKTIGTYTPEPDADGLIHTQYVNSTSTWRLGSRKVQFGTQIQNWGKREENPYAKEARKQIIARPGHKLVQIDSSAVEAVMQGYWMNDVDYMRTASKSIHAWLACKALGWEFNPDNIEKVKAEHEALYLRMKVVNYLTNFGGGAQLMTDTYPEQFATRAVAQATQDDLYRLLPSLKNYHHAVRIEAHTKTYLESPWGYRHYYYDVFKPSWKDTIQLGKDGKRCVAFKPQNCNAAFQRDNLLLTAASPIDGAPMLDLHYVAQQWDVIEKEIRAGNTLAQFMPTNVSVHDSEALDTPIQLVNRVAESQLAIFTRPIPEMRGLRIGAEVEVGDNWGVMERIAKVVIDDYTAEQTAAGLALAA